MNVKTDEDLVEKLHYDEDKGLVVETIYDNSEVLDANARDRNEVGTPTFGSKGQQLVKVASFHPGDIRRLKSLGYDLMSSDPAQAHRALVYVRDHEQKFLTTDKNVIADRKVIWQ